MTGSGAIHLLLHAAIPALIAWQFYRSSWLRSYLVMMAAMLVDLDHLLAMPLYDPHRCSIGFHPLHSGYAIAIYVALVFPKATRLIGVGLLIHMALDGIDCGVMRW